MIMKTSWGFTPENSEQKSFTAGGIALPTFTCNNSVALLLNGYPDALIYLDESHAQANTEPTHTCVYSHGK